MAVASLPIPTLEVALDLNHPQGEIIPGADWQAWFSQWGQRMPLSGSPIGAYELALKLTTDGDMAQFNQTFRQLDQPTDVLSFAALETDFPLTAELLGTEPLYLGDIIISLDTAERQARSAGHSLREETAWLAAHGFLHLLGWDHPDDASLAAMLAQQTELLAAVGIRHRK
ncbi:MAG: rRNA maturation RNase YbeY [Nodosilinea sp.]